MRPYLVKMASDETKIGVEYLSSGNPRIIAPAPLDADGNPEDPAWLVSLVVDDGMGGEYTVWSVDPTAKADILAARQADKDAKDAERDSKKAAKDAKKEELRALKVSDINNDDKLLSVLEKILEVLDIKEL